MAESSPTGSGIPQVISHYRLDDLLGGGGMGTVYKATDRRDGSAVAVKVLHPHLANDGTFRERFEREAHVGALLRSPYAVRLLDYGSAEGHYFIVMEYVDGSSLGQALQGGPVEVKRALRIAAQVARALEEAEARGVVHRDIKPDNILLGSGDSVKVADFGIARLTGGVTLTVPGAFVGTLSYAAPELALGKPDHRSDIYAVGATLFHVLTGRPPYQGDALAVLRQHADSPLPSELLAALPDAVVQIITRCLEKDPGQRYQSASALAGELERIAATTPQATPEATTVVETKPAESETSGSAQIEAATQVAGTPVQETEVAPARPTVQKAPPSAGAVTLQLARLKAGLPFGDSLRPTRYALTLRNGSDQAINLNLDARDDAGLCSFHHPDKVSVAAHESRTVDLLVRPRTRRWRGGRDTCPFTVTATSSGGGQPPVTVSGQFDDVSRGGLLYGGGLVAAVLVVAVLAALFAGGGGDSRAESIGEEQLELMVIPHSELGPEYSAFTPDPEESGYLTSGDWITGSCDSEAALGDIERHGRTNGYRSSYESNQSRESEAGTFLVFTEVETYSDSKGAEEDLRAFLNDPVDGLGKPECETLTTLNREEFNTSVIGDYSQGVEVLVRESSDSGSEVEYTLTIVGFVKGAMVGKVLIGHFDSPDHQREAEALARKLEGRIGDVLSGELPASPTPSPSPSPSPSASPAPSPSGSGSPSPSGTGSPTPTGTVSPTSTGTPATTSPPTPVPTQVPTPVPTQPTPVPTQVPTPVPTQVPTPVPTQVPTPVPTQAPTPVPTQVPTPVPTQAPAGQAYDFQWYVSASAMGETSACDFSLPVPANSPAQDGLCVTFYLDGFDGAHSYESRLYLDGALTYTTQYNLMLSPSVWHQAWPIANSPGSYFVEIYVDEVLVGTGAVTVSGIIAEIWVDWLYYQAGDLMEVCYTVNVDALFSLTYYLPDGSLTAILDGEAYAGETNCITWEVLPPRGDQCWEISAVDDFMDTGWDQACFVVE